MTGIVPEGTVLGQRGIVMGVEQARKRWVVVPGDPGRWTWDGTRIEVTELPPLLVVAGDRVGADAEPRSHFLMREAGVDGIDDLLAEVNGLGFHLIVNPTPLDKCNRL
jgi:hypothetical protein